MHVPSYMRFFAFFHQHITKQQTQQKTTNNKQTSKQTTMFRIPPASEEQLQAQRSEALSSFLFFAGYIALVRFAPKILAAALED